MRAKGHRGKYFLIVLFVAIFAFWWGIAVLTETGKAPSLYTQTAAPSLTSDASGSIAGPVAIELAVKGNVYTYSGSASLPNACDELSAGISASGANPQHVTIILTAVKPLTDCAEAAGGDTEQPFIVSLAVPKGSKALLDGLTFNGVIIATTLTTAQ